MGLGHMQGKEMVGDVHSPTNCKSYKASDYI